MEVGYVEEFEHGDFDRFCFGGGSNGYFVDDLRSLDVEHPKVKKARFAVSKVTQLEPLRRVLGTMRLLPICDETKPFWSDRS